LAAGVEVPEVISLLGIGGFATALLSPLSSSDGCEVSKLSCGFWFESCGLVSIIEISSPGWSELSYHAVHKVDIPLTSSMMCTSINGLAP
jgi:hypothetical protein